MLNTPAQRGTGRSFARMYLGLGLLACLGVVQAAAQTSSGNSPAYPVPVLVSDFELHSIPPAPKRTTRPPSAPEKPRTEVPLIYQEDDAPSEQARRLIDFFALTLVRTLEKSGLEASHSQSRTLPAGAQIRGVFAEPDLQNRIRRTILGAVSPNVRFLLYVGVFNLGRPQQPLYELATEQPGGSDYGPVITLNTYVPLAKYELDKNPSEEEVQKICNQIAASLQTLLKNNPNAFAH